MMHRSDVSMQHPRVLPSELKQRILAAVEREPAPAQKAVRNSTIGLLAGAAATLLAVFFFVGGVRMAPRPMSLMMVTAGGSSLLAFIALYISFGRGRSMLGRRRGVLLWTIVATPAALFVWKIAASAQFAGMTAEWPTRPGLRCLAHSIELGIVPLLMLSFLRRQSDPAHGLSTGAALGIAVGAVSWVFVDLWCPVAYPQHVLVGHVLPMVALAAGGIWLGRTVISIRARR